MLSDAQWIELEPLTEACRPKAKHRPTCRIVAGSRPAAPASCFSPSTSARSPGPGAGPARC